MEVAKDCLYSVATRLMLSLMNISMFFLVWGQSFVKRNHEPQNNHFGLPLNANDQMWVGYITMIFVLKAAQDK
jgi:hypothetical protein